jgi:hypothetical protein
LEDLAFRFPRDFGLPNCPVFFDEALPVGLIIGLGTRCLDFVAFIS